MSDKAELGKVLEALNDHVIKWSNQTGIGVTILTHDPKDGSPIGFTSTEEGDLRVARIVADALAQVLFRAEGVRVAVKKALA